MANNRKEDKTPATKADIESVLNKLDGLADHVGSVASQLDPMASQVNSLAGQVDSFTGKVDTLTCQVDSFTGKVDTLTCQVDSLTGKVDSLASQVERSHERIDQLHAEFREHTKVFAAHEATMSSQFKTVLEFIEAKSDDMHQQFGEVIEKLDEHCFNKACEHDAAIRAHDRRLKTIERRVGIPS